MINPILAEYTVGVFGSGSDEYDELAKPVGLLLAQLGVNLLTGGGRGVMTSVSRAFTEAARERGICIGIIPCASDRKRNRPKDGYPNPFVELAIYTHLPYSGDQGMDDLSRNHINVLSCVALIALPGGAGTAAEVSLAVDYQKPIISYSPAQSLVQHFPPAVRRSTTLDEVEQFLKKHIIVK
jgi:uncharacterized protein (TIGR00725 family)